MIIDMIKSDIIYIGNSHSYYYYYKKKLQQKKVNDSIKVTAKQF